MTRRARAVLRVVILVLGGVFSASARASPELAQTHHCLNCHQVDHKVVGPAYRDVAARYAGDPGAEERLADRIRQGGSGSWGAVPMPANNVTPDEARQLARWILSLK